LSRFKLLVLDQEGRPVFTRLRSYHEFGLFSQFVADSLFDLVMVMSNLLRLLGFFLTFFSLFLGVVNLV